MPWQKQTMVTYQTIGATLEAMKGGLQARNKDADITPEDRRKMTDTYNKAVSIYKAMYDVAVFAIDTGNREEYLTMKEDVLAMINTLETFIGEDR